MDNKAPSSGLKGQPREIPVRMSPILVLSLVSAVVAENMADIGNIQTAWAADAGDLVDIALTLQRYSEIRKEATGLLKHLMEIGVHTIEDTLKVLDRRI